jgi:hypothetical protein
MLESLSAHARTHARPFSLIFRRNGVTRSCGNGNWRSCGVLIAASRCFRAQVGAGVTRRHKKLLTSFTCMHARIHGCGAIASGSIRRDFPSGIPARIGIRQSSWVLTRMRRALIAAGIMYARTRRKCCCVSLCARNRMRMERRHFRSDPQPFLDSKPLIKCASGLRERSCGRRLGAHF